eukprot:296538-Chlamydomonas_euryale.AAC.1
MLAHVHAHARARPHLRVDAVEDPKELLFDFRLLKQTLEPPRRAARLDLGGVRRGHRRHCVGEHNAALRQQLEAAAGVDWSSVGWLCG